MKFDGRFWAAKFQFNILGAEFLAEKFAAKFSVWIGDLQSHWAWHRIFVTSIAQLGSGASQRPWMPWISNAKGSAGVLDCVFLTILKGFITRNLNFYVVFFPKKFGPGLTKTTKIHQTGGFQDLCPAAALAKCPGPAGGGLAEDPAAGPCHALRRHQGLQGTLGHSGTAAPGNEMKESANNVRKQKHVGISWGFLHIYIYIYVITSL